MDYSYPQTRQEDQSQYHQQQQQPYDPSRIQCYDQSYQSYYPYNHPQQYDHQQQYQPYYNPTPTTTTSQDYATSYDATAHHHQYHHEPTSIHPPGVPIPAEQPQTADPDPTHLRNAYYPHGVAEDQKQQVDSGSGSGYGGLNPAAVAALSQLTGNIEAAQRAAQRPIGQTPYRGGGRRGNRPFRGGGRGHFGYNGSRPDGSAAPFRGRGRGQGGGRHFQQYGAASTNPNSASVPAEGVAALMQPPSALVTGQAPLPTQVSSASFWRPPHLAWCELCRVDCNTPEILEQHKNGKRHKKNMLVHEELQKRNKVNTEQQNAQMPNTELKPEVGNPVRVEGFEEKQPLQENITSGVVTDDNRNETDQQDMGATSEAFAEPGNNSSSQFAGRGRGSKRRMRGGRGGKYIRTNDGSRRPVEPPKPKQVPFICELCNVKCESQVVFDSHVSGKKHLATLKRFQGHRALYGDVGLQALYPPNLNVASTSAARPVQQAMNDPQAPLAQLLVNYVLSQTQAQGSAAPPEPASAVAPVQGTNSGIRNQLDSLIQGAQVVCQDGSQNAVIEQIKNLLQSVQTYCESPAAGNADKNIGNGTSEFNGKEASGPIDTSGAVAIENPGTCEEGSGIALGEECEVAASDPFVQPQPEDQM
ncbi:uncharacterized protein LOC126586774 isoform X1 [Malus sylvestris]|uniref:uncharacterized protein LOC126586774 isoform X1 n=1 Tax=Malus sylvestris TaxID=3752 RepID=UPI0021ABC166|nr:uncharacterized protein LOC126586774 isoform X1 [Malus sylvestris]